MCGIRSAACWTSSALGNEGCHSGAGSVSTSGRSGPRTDMAHGTSPAGPPGSAWAWPRPWRSPAWPGLQPPARPGRPAPPPAVARAGRAGRPGRGVPCTLSSAGGRTVTGAGAVVGVVERAGSAAPNDAGAGERSVNGSPPEKARPRCVRRTDAILGRGCQTVSAVAVVVAVRARIAGSPPVASGQRPARPDPDERARTALVLSRNA